MPNTNTKDFSPNNSSFAHFSEQTYQLLIIDPAVEDYQSLVAGVTPNTKVHILDKNRDGIEQITEILSSPPPSPYMGEGTGVREGEGTSGQASPSLRPPTLHIISHGSPGSLKLGNSTLNAENLEQYQSQLQQWQTALTPKADIFIYGCNVAEGVTGQAFIQQLAHLTTANIAASTTPTGNEKLGGNWNLEFIIGEIQAALAFSPAVTAAYSGILGDGPGGIGSTDGTSELQWWLRGDKGVTATTTVSSWADQSGVGLDATQATAASQPTFTANALNGQPVVSFDGTTKNLQTPTLPATFATNSTSLFLVANTKVITYNAIIGNGTIPGTNRYSVHLPWVDGSFYWDMGHVGNGGRLSPGWSGSTGTPYGWHFRSEQGVGQRIERDGTSVASDNDTSPFNPTGETLYVNNPSNYGYNGDVAEIISYNRALNDAESTIVNNYLSAKYGLTNGNDKYAGDNAGSDYDWNVAGIGKEANGSNTSANTTGGLIINNGTFLQDNGDYLIAGEKDTTANPATLVTTDLPTGGNNRLSRLWYLDKTDVNTNGGITNITVDFSDSGFGGTPSGTYRLLYRAGQTGTFSIVNSTATFTTDNATITGDQVTFNNVAASLLADGYYALASTINNSPLIDTIANASINEEAAQQTITLTGISDIETATNALTLTATSDNTGLTGTPTITNNNDGTATLQYTPVANANGTANISVTVTDADGGTVTQSFAVNVNAINDQPSFSNAGNQTLAAWTNTAQTVANWANSFNFGPNETGQAVADFLVSVTSGNNLFTTMPDIANDGTLTYTPTGEPGTATISVQLQDNGGVVNGGVDTSAAATFNIIIPPPTVNLTVDTTTGTEAGTIAITLTATAAGPVVGNQTLNLAFTGTVDNSDFSGTIPTQITIADGSNSGQVTLTVANDLIDEDSETATFTIGNPTAGISLGTTTAQTITITDDDTAGYDITGISGDTSEFGGQATFDIHLSSQPIADVTLNFTSSDTTEGTVIPTVTFDATNWNIPQTVTITGVDDAVADDNITYNITSTATSTDPKYNNNNPNTVTVTNTDNDIPGVTITQTGGNTELTEGSITDTYTIQLNTLPTGNVQITATADAQTQVSLDGVNFAASQTLTFTNVNGMTAQTVTVRAIDDTTPEDYHSGGITHAITNSADVNYPTTMTVGDVNPHITDNDISYTLTGSSTTVTEGNSGSQQLTYNITRTGAINETSTVDFNFSGTAANTIDYNLVSITGTGITTSGSTITFAPNATQSTITVEVLGDQIDEDNETFILSLLNPTATGTPTVIGSPVTSTITDDDTAAFIINPTSGLTTTEAGGTSSFDVHLTSQPTANVAINLSSDNTAEGTIDKNSLTFTPANWSTPQTVTITGVDDLVDDGNIAYNIITAAATSTDAKYNGINADDVAVTNTDNDIAGVTITQTGGNTQLSEGGITDTYSIALNTLPIGNVQITATADAQTQVSLDGVNFAASQTLTFTPVNGMTAQTVTVRAINDNTTENIHSGSITNAITNSADANYPTTMALDGITANITDNDISYTLTGGSANITEGNSGTQQLTYNITRTGALNETSTVDFNFSGTATNIADYKLVSVTGTGVTASGSPITFAPNATSATITAEIVGEQIDEDDETLILSLVNPTATGTASVIGSPVNTTITDDDTAGFTITPTSLTTTEAAGTATFTVALNTQPTADVKINLSSDNTAEGIIDKPSLTFNASNWNQPQTVTVTGVDDFGDDGDIPYNIITSVATSTDTKYNGINPVDVAVTNTDNDTAGVALSSTNVAAYEGGSGGSYTAVLTSKPTAPVTVNFNGGRQINPLAALKFDSNNWNVPQPVIITAIDDGAAEGLQTEIISHTVTSGDAKYNGVTVGTVAASITDNDTPAAPVVEPLGRMDVRESGGEDVYKLFLTTQPTATVNVAIVTDGQTTANVPYLTFTPSDWNIPQLVRVSAVDDNVVEGPHTSNISFVASSADGFYQGLPISGIVANIADNDNVGLVRSLPTPGTVMGTGADDNLVGSSGPDVINVRNGNNRVEAGAGDDVVLAGNDADYITGGAGLDQILSGPGEDYVDGGDDEDVIFAGTGSDRLYGGSGNDKLFGEQGDDYLSGDGGVDTLTGGVGRDAFAVANGFGGMTVEMADVITDFVKGEDIIDLIPSLVFGDLSMVQNGADAVIQNRVTGEFLAVLQGVDTVNLSPVDFV